MFHKLIGDLQAEIIKYLEYSELIQLLKAFKELKIKDSIWITVINLRNLNHLLEISDKQFMFNQPSLDYYDIYIQHLINKNKNESYQWNVEMIHHCYYEDIQCDEDFDYKDEIFEDDTFHDNTDGYVFLYHRCPLDNIIEKVALSLYANYFRYKLFEIKSLPKNDKIFDGIYSTDDYIIKYIIVKCNYTYLSIANMETECYKKVKFVPAKYYNDMSNILCRYLKQKMKDNFNPEEFTSEITLKTEEPFTNMKFFIL